MFLLLACAPSAPTSPEECTRPWVLGAARVDCQTEVAVGMFPDRAAEGVAYVEATFTDPLHADFVWLQVTLRADPSGKYCSRIQDPVLEGRCEERARRPHLNRGLPAGPGGGPGGAPGPGSGPPPAPAEPAPPAPARNP